MNQIELYWKYENKFPFEYSNITTAPFNEFFAPDNDLLNATNMDSYRKLNDICLQNGIPNFLLPFIGSEYFNKDSSRILLIAESKYIDLKDKKDAEKSQDYEAGRIFFNWVLDYLINGVYCNPTKEIMDFVHKYRYSIFNQEPIISYIKVRSAELGFEKMRYRDFPGWPFPYLIRAINEIYGYNCSKKMAQLKALKGISFTNYYQIPFVVDGSVESNGFSENKFSSLVLSKRTTYETYKKMCDLVLDNVIDYLHPKLIIFASEYGASSYKGKYSGIIRTIYHPASWRYHGYAKKKTQLESFIRDSKENR